MYINYVYMYGVENVIILYKYNITCIIQNGGN